MELCSLSQLKTFHMWLYILIFLGMSKVFHIQMLLDIWVLPYFEICMSWLLLKSKIRYINNTLKFRTTTHTHNIKIVQWIHRCKCFCTFKSSLFEHKPITSTYTQYIQNLLLFKSTFCKHSFSHEPISTVSPILFVCDCTRHYELALLWLQCP